MEPNVPPPEALLPPEHPGAVCDARLRALTAVLRAAVEDALLIKHLLEPL